MREGSDVKIITLGNKVSTILFLYTNGVWKNTLQGGGKRLLKKS